MNTRVASRHNEHPAPRHDPQFVHPAKAGNDHGKERQRRGERPAENRLALFR